MFNANTLHQVLHTQAQFNVDLLKREARRKIEFDRSRAEWNSLYYEVLHNLVLETTRMGIEVQNLRMKLESQSSRLDFSERRVRALEGVVQYRPEVVRGADRHDDRDDDHTPAPQTSAGAGSVEGFVPAGAGNQPGQGQGDGSARRKRRRRRGRRGGTQGALGASGASGAPGAQGAQAADGGQGAGPQDTEAYEAGEDGGDDGDEFENGDEMSSASAPDHSNELRRDEASGGFAVSASAPADTEELRRDKPEPVDEPVAAPQAPQAPQALEASAFAPEESNELRRDKPQAPEAPKAPGSDDTQ
jgi:hypothetical protein